MLHFLGLFSYQDHGRGEGVFEIPSRGFGFPWHLAFLIVGLSFRNCSYLELGSRKCMPRNLFLNLIISFIQGSQTEASGYYVCVFFVNYIRFKICLFTF